VLSETASEERIVLSAETAPSIERITERKTIVYETRIDQTVIKVEGEKVKDYLFMRFGFLRPKPGEVELVSVDKYYEPYVVISGRYAIDYYRRCAYTVSINKEVREVILSEHKFEPNRPIDPSAKDHNVIRLDGEERIMNEIKAFLILDRSGQDVEPKELPSAPSEKSPKEILAGFGVEEIGPDWDLEIIQSRVIQRPKDINRLVSEIFEVNERAVIYTPRFRARYKNVKTGEEKTVEFDGVTAKRIQQSQHASSHKVLFSPPPPPSLS
jgi:hypothetical protein